MHQIKREIFDRMAPKVPGLQSKVRDVISAVMNNNGVLTCATKFRNHVPKGQRKAIYSSTRKTSS